MQDKTHPDQFAGTRERHIESILQSTLRQIILIHNYPRALIQVTLQITSIPGNDAVGSKLVQADSVGRVLRVVLSTDSHTEPSNTPRSPSNSCSHIAVGLDSPCCDPDLGDTGSHVRWPFEDRPAEPYPNRTSKRRVDPRAWFHFPRRASHRRERRELYIGGLG